MDLEKLELELSLKKRELERKEDSLFNKKEEGIEKLHEIAKRSKHYLRGLSDDTTELNMGLRQLEKMEDDIEDAYKKEKRQIKNNLDDLNTEYSIKRKNLLEGK